MLDANGLTGGVGDAHLSGGHDSAMSDGPGSVRIAAAGAGASGPGVGRGVIVLVAGRPPLDRPGVPVSVVPVPPLVRRGLWVAVRRIFPVLLASQRGDVEVAPRGPQGSVSAVVDEVGAVHAVAVANERIRTVPLVHTEVDVESV